MDITNEQLSEQFDRFVRGPTTAVEREIAAWLVREGLRHHLCRFVAQLGVEHKVAASRFVRALEDVQVTPHVLRWVKIVHLLEHQSGHSEFITDLCDILEAEDKVLRKTCMTLEDCRTGDDLEEIQDDLDVVVATLQSLR